MITEADIVNDLLRIKILVKKYPSKKTYRKLGKYSITTICKKFGCWSNAFQRAFDISPILNKPKAIHPCVLCGKHTKNSKFCSSSCAASHNNKIYPKRPPAKKCPGCGKARYNKAISIYCCKCKPPKYAWETITIKEIQDKAKYQISALIRNIARKIYRKSNQPKCCTICGYDKHYEVCHKKSINSFSHDTLVSVVNDTSNLIALCPNHHWEFDNGLLSL